LAAGVALAGCHLDGVSFIEDSRVDVVQPADNSRVKLPFELRWTATRVDGRFAVLFDRSPMAPGRPLRSLMPKSDSCGAVGDCPDAAWLAAHYVYLTAATRVVVTALPDRRRNGHTPDTHQATIVMVDRSGRRIGQSAFIRDFTVERGS
jgi:hypothetical protein